MIKNWPDDGLVVEVGRSGEALTEEDLLKACALGLNLPIQFGEKSYLPPSRGLMMDGTGYDASARTIPLVVMAKRFDPALSVDPRAVNPSGIMMLGVAPDDPRPPWEIAAEHLGRLSVQRRGT